MQAVWGSTIVEEGGLTRNISVLRKTLGENPDEHRYIVTAPGRGYCFVAAVRKMPIGGEKNDEVKTAVIEAEAESHSALSDASPAKRLKLQRLGVVASIVTLVAVAMAIIFNWGPANTSRDSILLADFANRTGEAVFDGTLREGLAVQLEQSP